MKLFLKPSTIVIHHDPQLWAGQIRMDGQTNTCTHIHRTVVVTTVSHSSQAGSTKMYLSHTCILKFSLQLNPLPDNKDSSKLKEFADNDFKLD